MTHAGAVDPSYTPPDIGVGLDTGFNPAGSVYATAIQSNGNLLVVGSQLKGIDRLLPNGQADPNFNVGAGTGGEQVAAVAQQSDGSILIGGEFTTVSGTSTSYLTRLMPDGTIDPTYQPQLDSAVRAITMLSSGMVAVGGDFTTINGSRASKLARLDSSGNPDPTFSPAGADGTVYSIAEKPDGSGGLLVGGAFNNIGGAQSANLGQVLADGTADPAFNPGTLAATGTKGTDGTVQVVKFVNDGSGNALVGGSFANVGAVAAPALLRVTPSGAADPTFRAGGAVGDDLRRQGQSATAAGISNGNNPATVYSLDIQNDGKVVIGGAFAAIAGTIQNSMARLLPDGSVDPQFQTGSGANALVRSVTIQSDGKPVVAGGFTSINNASLGGVGRLTADDGTVAFFSGQQALDNGIYYLAFADSTPFGYFSLDGTTFNFPLFYHLDLGFEFCIDANDGSGGVYLYDFASGGFFYTSSASSLQFPYLYDFSLNSVLYYYPDPAQPGRYNTNGVRYFYNFATRQIIMK